MDIDASFARLRDRIPHGVVRMLDGAGGVKVICQERHRHNFDLTHENWAEAGEEALGGVGVLITGEKGAGKTTFLAGLTSGSPGILQALRYDASSFYNIWYGVEAHEIDALLQSLDERDMGYFQTELAHGSMVIPGGEYWMFQDDEEFKEPADAPPPPPIPFTHVLLRVIEIGGDALAALKDPPASKRGVYASIRSMLTMVDTICCFIGAGPEESVAGTLARLKESLGDSVGGLRQLVLFTRNKDVTPAAMVAAARGAGFACEVLAYYADHVDAGTGRTDTTEVLRTVHRMTRHATVDAAALRELVSEQVAGLLLRSHPTADVTQQSYSEMLEEVHHDIEHGSVYDETFQPVFALPPAYLTTVYHDVMEVMVRRCFALPPARVTLRSKPAAASGMANGGGGGEGPDPLPALFTAETSGYRLPADPALRALVQRTLGLELRGNAHETRNGTAAGGDEAAAMLPRLLAEARYYDVCIAAALCGRGSIPREDGTVLDIEVDACTVAA